MSPSSWRHCVQTLAAMLPFARSLPQVQLAKFVEQVDPEAGHRTGVIRRAASMASSTLSLPGARREEHEMRRIVDDAMNVTDDLVRCNAMGNSRRRIHLHAYHALRPRGGELR
ncbi:hypothetical protein C8F04DRAFT_307343 [Mycena alexandri]|uniref:Uncharacterized protein n=1 Tax=Mycena alexandri TaxID=1745969 RepID=A0AAD6X8M3_9AGAR|nr:hypothetical protein C8F04DRAFT_307343 [Mycena alexandri]